MNLYDEFFSIIEAFENNNISYAVIGGFAMAFHSTPRFTDDIDILISHSDLANAKKILRKLNFFQSTDPHPFLKVNLLLHRFVKTLENDYLVVDILCSEEKQFSKMVENAIKKEWEKGVVSIVNQKDLIYLKKIRNSDQDKVDIKKLENHEEKNGN